MQRSASVPDSPASASADGELSAASSNAGSLQDACVKLGLEAGLFVAEVRARACRAAATRQYGSGKRAKCGDQWCYAALHVQGTCKRGGTPAVLLELTVLATLAHEPAQGLSWQDASLRVNRDERQCCTDAVTVTAA